MVSRRWQGENQGRKQDSSKIQEKILALVKRIDQRDIIGSGYEVLYQSHREMIVYFNIYTANSRC